MNPFFILQLRWLTTVFMLAMASMFVVNCGSFVVSEVEVVECEEFEAVATRRFGHPCDRDIPTSEFAACLQQLTQSIIPPSSTHSGSERRKFNGSGCYLLA